MLDRPTELRRPYTLAEVADRLEAGDDWSIALPEFLDTFYFALRGYPYPAPQRCLDPEPVPVADPVRHAMLGAVAEHLAQRWHQDIPRWVHQPCRFLKAPTFPGDTQDYRGYYFTQAPVAFRRRMIFTEAEPLRRARFPCTEFYESDRERGHHWTPGALLGVFGSMVGAQEGRVHCAQDVQCGNHAVTKRTYLSAPSLSAPSSVSD